MKFRLIPAGEFLMGSPESEANRKSDEQQHHVRITKPFYLGVTEVTQGQWVEVMSTASWKRRLLASGLMNIAVGTIYKNDALTFCKKLSRKDESYRLPTEAEWEYACRAGTATAYHFGDDPALLNQYGHVKSTGYNSDYRYIHSFSHPVGTKKPNPFGIFDMYGNAQEYCSDLYSKTYYVESELVNPSGPKTGGVVLRGGDRKKDASTYRSAARSTRPQAASKFSGGFPYMRNGGYTSGDQRGFRLVLEVKKVSDGVASPKDPK
ncbi:formylglycine-generating enzyme family protein [Rubripirellula amarantea]|nr:formylglycine-generating enzyme family protein [Rubripirellula amarantea]